MDRRDSPFLLAVLLLTLLGSAAIRVRLLSMPLERDEAEIGLAGQLILQGIPPYTKSYDMRWPGTFYSYAAIEAVFGQTSRGIHLGIVLVNLAAVVLVFLIARRLLDAYAAVAAAIAYAALSLSPSTMALAGQTAHFVVLCALAAIFFLQQALATRRLGFYLLAGIFAGLAPMMKQPGAVFTAFVVAYWAYGAFRRREAWRRMLPGGIALGAGIAVALGMMLGSVLVTHTFGVFWLWTVSYPRYYGLSTPLADTLRNFLMYFVAAMWECFLFWVVAVFGACLLWRHPRTRARAPFLLGLLCFSFLGVLPGLLFRVHYFILMLPAVSFLCGAAVFVVRRRSWRQSPVAAGIKSAGLVLVPLGVALFGQEYIYFRATPVEACRLIYGSENPFVECIDVARYIGEHTEPHDTVAVVGSEPEIYFYSRRRPATGHILTYPLMEPQPYAHQFQEQMIQQIEAARPKYVVSVNMPYSWLATPASDPTLRGWFARFRQQQLELVAVVERDAAGRTTFVPRKPTAQELAAAPPLFSVYRRLSRD